MKRFLVLLLAALAIPAGADAQRTRPAQRSTLPAFRSDAELARFLAEHEAERERRMAVRRDSMAAVQDSIAALRGTCAWADAVTRAATPLAPDDPAAPPAVVRGRVVDGAGQPLSAVLIRVEGTTHAATTAADGEFRVEVPRERLGSAVVVSASRLGLARARRALSLAPGDSARIGFCLGSGETWHLPEVLASRAAGVSVTNVQHAGVDEGGIVKVHGEHLVILRRGRLFTVRMGARDLRPVAAVDAYGPGIDPEDAWYDEMLISGDVVIVIGYRYGGSGTEVGLFRIDAAGRLRHGSTYHLRSNDYYSSRNYASRLVEGKLVFYTPLSIGAGPEEDLAEQMPALRRWNPAPPSRSPPAPAPRAPGSAPARPTAPRATGTARSAPSPRRGASTVPAGRWIRMRRWRCTPSPSATWRGRSWTAPPRGCWGRGDTPSTSRRAPRSCGPRSGGGAGRRPPRPSSTASRWTARRRARWRRRGAPSTSSRSWRARTGT